MSVTKRIGKRVLRRILVIGIILLLGAGFLSGWFAPYKYKDSHFTLTISVSETTFEEGQDIEVEMVFKNKSGKTLLITHADPMVVAFIETDTTYEEIRADVSVSGRTWRNEEKKNTVSMGSLLPPGEYELCASAVFNITKVQDNIRILSNTITITVV